MQAGSMRETSPATVRIEGEGTTSLEATMTAVTPETVQVRYRVRNAGSEPLAVFDRGDRHAVLTKRQVGGAIGAPTFEESGGGDVVLRHVARPLAGRLTGPTLPATPLALKLNPGAAIDGEFTFSIPTSTRPERVRWCIGVAPFDDAEFFSPEASGAGEVWQVRNAAVARQRLLCTPWFAMAAGQFEDG